MEAYETYPLPKTVSTNWKIKVLAKRKGSFIPKFKMFLFLLANCFPEVPNFRILFLAILISPSERKGHIHQTNEE